MIHAVFLSYGALCSATHTLKGDIQIFMRILRVVCGIKGFDPEKYF